MREPYYKDDSCTIYHGDCMDILPDIKCVDVVLTDPPYGLAESSSDKNKYGIFQDTASNVFRVVTWLLAFYPDQRIVMTPGQKMMFKYREPNAVGAFYYPKATGSCSWGFVGWQPIYFYGKDPYLQRGMGRRINSFMSTEISPDNGHPCPKPIKQWSWLLQRCSMKGETVIDPFMGSGTTLRAAKDLHRKAIGVELEEKYCEIAAKRLQQEVFDFGGTS